MLLALQPRAVLTAPMGRWSRAARRIQSTNCPPPRGLLRLFDPLATSDHDLVAALADGDDSALAVLYDRHAPLLLGIARRMLGDPNEAEDLVHDVMMAAWRDAERYQPGRASVRSWLCMRLRSRALDRLRSARVRRSESLDDHPRGADGFAAPPSSQDGSGDEARLHAVLADLAAPQREVLELAYFQGLSSSEIATHLGIPIGTVKSRTASAFGRLRQALGEGLA
jgi:RNA polymerase sigma-70 factor, ECF subfamily